SDPINKVDLDGKRQTCGALAVGCANGKVQATAGGRNLVCVYAGASSACVRNPSLYQGLQVHRAFANLIPNIVGILTAEVAFGAKCRWVDEGYKVCSSAHFWFGQTGAVTIGSTIITSSSQQVFMADKVTV